ncbi:PREDICTED: LOW QUALITY PROTEIN: uncharacterized protein LOC106328498 [Brassica oleracea var. oleracea]|uniref:LOW QUALITY PROTEIN: uncharacterized protein LOC106328498 n=1 Tax=Brassica oleracea var. oleracea TaxID=109376 RepID=UPI0006A742B3|nr:PREDICTED: LOW QUALITY PROTEIN: uncharacterized protein LOC106328498 [Brassica oleracea var. oleracea]
MLFDDSNINGLISLILIEAERRIAAIKAIRDIEIEQSLTAQRLLCSYFTEEQLETPVLDFFKENLPDVSIEVEDNGEIEFKWNHNTGLSAENRMLASHDALQASEVIGGQRLHFGMTAPKTRRQPKPGEMMLSVHGTPLGVYEENLN